MHSLSKTYLNEFSERFWKSLTIIVPKQFLLIVAEYSMSIPTLQDWNVCHFRRVLKRSFGRVYNRRWAALAHIYIWILIASTTFLFNTFYTVVSNILSVNTCSFQNLYIFKYSLPVSRTDRRHPERIFSVSRIQLGSNFSACSRLTIRFPRLSLPLSYSFDLTSAQQ